MSYMEIMKGGNKEEVFIYLKILRIRENLQNVSMSQGLKYIAYSYLITEEIFFEVL